GGFETLGCRLDRHDLIGEESEHMRMLITIVVPEVKTVRVVSCTPTRSVVHWSATTDQHVVVLLAEEGQDHFRTVRDRSRKDIKHRIQRRSVIGRILG